MSITFNEFTIEAYEQVFSLWQRCEGIGLSQADSKGNIQHYLERNPGLSRIARNGNSVVGTILCGHDGRRGYVHHLAVSPEFRRQGIGRRLVEDSLAALKTAGIEKCHLFIFSDNLDGRRFWQHIGWTFRTDIAVISKIIT
jgi:ribosomal protein S18 acetylase RimI-like enzyme